MTTITTTLTTKEMIDKLLEKPAYDLLLHLFWYAEKINCRECIENNRRLGRKIPVCSRCVPAKFMIYKTSGEGDIRYENKQEKRK